MWPVINWSAIIGGKFIFSKKYFPVWILYVISTNESTWFITGHMIYTLAYNSRQQPPNIWYTTFPKGLPHKTFFKKIKLVEVFSPFLKTSFDFRLQVQQMHRDQDPGWPAQNSIHRQQKNQHNYWLCGWNPSFHIYYHFNCDEQRGERGRGGKWKRIIIW